MPRLDESVSEQFYAYERRGRGWKIHGFPVALEPPFLPFRGYNIPRSLDDGRRPTLLSSFVRRLSHSLAPEIRAPPVITEDKEEEQPLAMVERADLVESQIIVPREHNLPSSICASFLAQLSSCSGPVTFEILGTPQNVAFQFVTSEVDAPNLRRQVAAHFPNVGLLPQSDRLLSAWLDSEEEAVVIEFGLENEFVLPLARSFKVDPFVGLLASMAELGTGELGLFQVHFQAAEKDWRKNMVAALSAAHGKTRFVNAAHLLQRAEEKLALPVFAVVVRLVAKASTFERAWAILRDIAFTLRVFASLDGNALLPLDNEEYPFEEHLKDVFLRQSRRSGMLLNIEELTGLVHFPSSDLHSQKLIRRLQKTKAAPECITGNRGGVVLGQNVHLGRSVPVSLTPDERMKHCHIIGASGTGKSTLLFNLIAQDIKNGDGVAVLDPHGDLIDSILAIIPPERREDVILVDPADMAYAVPFNVLNAHSELEKNLLASDLVSVFQRLSSSWGEQMGSVLRNAVLAFLESPRGGSLVDLRRFLLEPAFRNDYLATVTDQEVVYYWQKAFPHLAGNKSLGSVLTRLDNFLGRKPIRAMVSQKENRIDFGRIMDERKIFLAKLARGLVGQENSYLLGSLFVAKIQQIAMGRQAQKVAARRPFYLFIDEFADFITPSMAEILTAARKYRLGLVLAHQGLQQLEREGEVASALMSNAYSRVVFRVGHDDARKLVTGFASFEPQDFQNLDKGQAICRIERSDYDFNLSIPFPEQLNDAIAGARRNEVIHASRRKYGVPGAQVDARESEYKPVADRLHEGTEDASATPPRKSSSGAVPVVSEFTATSIEETARPELTISPSPDLRPSAGEQKPWEKSNRSAHELTKDHIMEVAERLGYSVGREKEILDGKGRVDLVLTRGNRRIACQVCSTTHPPHEIGNAKKCLQEGFYHIAVIFPAANKLPKIKKAFRGAFSSTELKQVGFYLVDELISNLHKWAKADPEGGAIEAAKPRKRDDISLTECSAAERQIRHRKLLEELREAMKGESST